jgi:hypothetical protein
VRQANKAEAEAAAFGVRLLFAGAQQLRHTKPLTQREPMSFVPTAG